MDDARRINMTELHRRMEPAIANAVIEALGTEGARDPDNMVDVLRVLCLILAQSAGMTVATAARQGHVGDTGRAEMAGLAARELLRVAQIEPGDAPAFDFRKLMKDKL